MAHPLARTSALDLLEETLHALRALPMATLACHAIGSVPLYETPTVPSPLITRYTSSAVN